MPHATLRDWVMSYLTLQYFKLANEESVYQVSSKSSRLTVGLFVTCVLETLPRPTLKDNFRGYCSSKRLMRNMCIKLQQNRQACKSGYLIHVFWRLCPPPSILRDWVRAYLSL
ncbi:hypothetical protein AVEN_144447-1 [Araneus ventricosus]|uniref:Uncharacterized protein n=1 Tax=Araneus ventricosus TaxID=182803 RepID=A0A4Y2E4A5_ARAVE|nr:hypothetical protein AVEN_144447-1 [Araneus ventricosus]